jgi:predicted MPP superfamily phosphohydrolase
MNAAASRALSRLIVEGERLTAALAGLLGGGAERSRSTARRWVLAGAATVGGLAVALGALSRFTPAAWPRTTHTRVPWRGPRLRIVALVDLGAPGGGAKRTARIVRRANALAPDLVLLPGGVAGGLAEPGAPLALAPLAGLRSRFGAYAVVGEHDGARRYLEHTHIRVLDDERVPVGGAVLVGLRGGAPGDAFAGVDETQPVVVLAREPSALDQPGVGRFDVAIAGHVFALPGGGTLHVSAGLGDARPEIPVLDLVPRPRRRGRARPRRAPAAARVRRGDPSR